MRYLYCAILLAGVLPASLAADNLSPTNCPADTSLADYVADFSTPTTVTNRDTGKTTGPCSSGILNFSQFAFEAFGSGAVGDNQIYLTPINPGNGDLGDTGFTISGLSAAAGQQLTYVIDWYAEIDAGPYMGGAQVDMDPPFGDVTITQSYCVDSFIGTYSPTAPFNCSWTGSTDGPPVQSLTVTVPNPSASILFKPVAQNFAWVRTVIQLNTNDDSAASSFDTVNGSATVDPSAPEPASVVLIPAALLMLYLQRRRQNTKRV